MILYIENPKVALKRTLTNEFNKVTGLKINIQKFSMILYTDNKTSEREIKKTTQFTIVS